MTIALAFDFTTAFFAAIAAFFWAASARVKWADGFDMADERTAAWKRAGRLNSWGASFAALAAATPAVKGFLQAIHFIV